MRVQRQINSSPKGKALSTPAVIEFASGAAAAALVAGVPAAARAVREVALAGVEECWLRIADKSPLPASVRQEIARLAGTMPVRGLDGLAVLPGTGSAPCPLSDRPEDFIHRPLLAVEGEALVDAATIRAALASASGHNPALRFGAPDSLPARAPGRADVRRHYARAGRAIVAATAKSTDGIVSRSLNRPISQAISRTLLRIPGIQPIHATMGTAAIGLMMFTALVALGSPVGLVLGALLFHAASVFDGVDGEIARATLRTSDRGAQIDTLIDAATNLAFIFGTVINLALRGRWLSASFGGAGLVMLTIGLTVLGGGARRRGAPISFDGLKQRFRASGRLGQWAVWLTMRDFLAAAAVVLFVAGLADEAIIGFSAIMTVWLVVILSTHARHSALGA